MIQIIKRFYILGFLTIITVLLSLYYHFDNTGKIIQKNTQTITELSTQVLEREINSWLSTNGQIVDDASDYIMIEPENKPIILSYLKQLLDQNPTFSSLYFGTPDNIMINASGWKPPSNFDLRTRPWYIKAVAEKKIIFSQVFVNGSKNDLIITIAKPIYNSENKLLGVVGGDVSLKTIVALVRGKKISEHGYSFLVDGKNNILAHPNYEYNVTSKLIHLNEISEGIDKVIIQNDFGLEKVILNGIDGYIAYQSIKNTDWKIGSFIPLNEYDTNMNEQSTLFLTNVLMLLLLFSLFIGLQKRYILNPILLLDQNIRRIDIEKNLAYRLPILMTNDFASLDQSINRVLDKTQEYFLKIEKEDAELQRQYKLVMESQNKLKESENRWNIALAAEKELFQMTLLSVGDGVITTDNNRKITMFNQVASEITGWTAEESLGKSFEDIFHIMNQDTGETSENAVRKALDTGRSVFLKNSEVLVTKNGKKVMISDSAAPIKNLEGIIQGAVVVFRDVTLEKKRQERIRYLSYHDKLTGLYNRSFFEVELKRLDTNRSLPLTIIMADVNGLKITNDAFGHVAGDNLLKKSAEILKMGCRTEDIITRAGGDEFIIILPKATPKEAEKIIQRIRMLISKTNVDVIAVSIAFGFATKTKVTEDIQEILKQADNSMYENKALERHNVKAKLINSIETLYKKKTKEEAHSKAVGELCRKIGNAYQLAEENLKELETAGLWHDIGKTVLDEAILTKTSELNESEWLEIRKHPELGNRILESFGTFSAVAKYVLAHHEKWDGTGYPKGLKGEEIPWEARVVAIAEAYDAMSSEGSYRQAFSKEMAIEEIRNHAGTQFDPDMARVFIRMMEKENLTRKI